MSGNWKAQKVVIVGAARQGIALARYLSRHGARVVLTDLRTPDQFTPQELDSVNDPQASFDVEWVLGEHPLSLLDGADLLCLSGGVPPTIPLAREAQAHGIPLSNDSQIFLESAPCKVIGITGSSGKSTTTALVGEIARHGLMSRSSENGNRAPRVWVGGNIGSPLIAVLDEMEADDLAVMELSSFQLELMDRAPQVAVILNITPNHLDRHGTMEVYTRIKARILDFQHPSDVAVLGRDDPIAWSLARKVHGYLMSFGMDEPAEGMAGTYYKDGVLYLRMPEEPAVQMIMPRTLIRLRGEHNLLNVLAACAIAAAAGLSPDAMRAGVEVFTGLAHRLEFVRTWGGADWYNDSIATAPERTIAAIKSFDQSLVLLVGGRDKGLPWEDLARLILQRVDHLVVFGEATGIILDALKEAADAEMTPGERVSLSGAGDVDVNWQQIEGLTVSVCSNLQEAVQEAARLVEPGDVVLLSPGGTSFDEFKDFEERGECFVQLVKSLA
jgi:UDP-N-acetylmuramoylalanine--D-glutamate ligase